MFWVIAPARSKQIRRLDNTISQIVLPESRGFFAPAGMDATTLDPQEVMDRDDFTYGHHGGAPEFIYAPDGYDCGAYSPSGLVFSTVENLARFARLMMSDGGELLSEESVAAMQGHQIYLDYDPDYFYGFGVFIEPYQDLEVRYHGGNVPGWGTVLLCVPERGYVAQRVAD